MPRPSNALQDVSFLTAALEGLEHQKKRIEEQIEQVRAMLGGRKVKAGASPVLRAGRKRELSPEARRRIAMAQKRRWAEHRKAQAAQAKEG